MPSIGGGRKSHNSPPNAMEATPKKALLVQFNHQGTGATVVVAGRDVEAHEYVALPLVWGSLNSQVH